MQSNPPQSVRQDAIIERSETEVDEVSKLNNAHPQRRPPQRRFSSSRDTIETSSRQLHSKFGIMVRRRGGTNSDVIYKFQNVQVNLNDALSAIELEARSRGRQIDLPIVLAGLKVWANNNFARLIALPIADEAYISLLHSSGLCERVKTCCDINCRNSRCNSLFKSCCQIIHRLMLCFPTQDAKVHIELLDWQASQYTTSGDTAGDDGVARCVSASTTTTSGSTSPTSPIASPPLDIVTTPIEPNHEQENKSSPTAAVAGRV